MSNTWGLGLDAEISYRQQRVRSDFQRSWRRQGKPGNAVGNPRERANADLNNAALAHAALTRTASTQPAAPQPAAAQRLAGRPPVRTGPAPTNKDSRPVRAA